MLLKIENWPKEIKEQFELQCQIVEKPITKEVLRLTAEEAKAIIYDGSDDFYVLHKDITDHQRWTVGTEVLVYNYVTKKFYTSYYTVGASDGCDPAPYEVDDPDFVEVFPVQQVINTFSR